jgi:hypothetical protein
MDTAALPAARTWGRYGPADEQGLCRNSVVLADGSGRRSLCTEDLLVVDVPMDLNQRTRTEMTSPQRSNPPGALVAPAQQ